MAQFGIFVAFGDDKSAKIKGNSKVAGYEDWVLGESVHFGSSAMKTHGAKGKKETKVTASIGSIAVTLHGGAATAEIYKMLFSTTALATVSIHQCLQPADAASNQKPDLIQKIDLKDVFIVGINETWTPSGERTINIDLEFAHFMLTVGTKPADITVRNLSKAAGNA